MSKWKKIYTASNLQQASIIEAVLMEYQLNPVIINKKDACYGFGHFEVHVPALFIFEASKILSERNLFAGEL